MRATSCQGERAHLVLQITIHLRLPAPASTPDIDIQPLDLLVKRGQRNTKRFGRFGLAPITLLELLDDLPPFEIGDDFE